MKITTIKDIIYILLFIGVCFGWYLDRHTENTITNEQIHTIITNVEDLNTKMDKQSELNGKFIMYIQIDSNN